MSDRLIEFVAKREVCESGRERVDGLVVGVTKS